jgi:hypothetical protein
MNREEEQFKKVLEVANECSTNKWQRMKRRITSDKKKCTVKNLFKTSTGDE